MNIAALPGGSPWTFQLHAWAWVAIALAAGGYVVALGALGASYRTPAKKQLSFACGLLAVAAALTWPVADLARTWSLLAHMGQTVLLVLVAPPLLIIGIPRWLVDLATEPRAVDAVLRRLTRPVAAVLVFNAAIITSLLPNVVNAASRSAAVNAAVHLMLLSAGVVMWVPALRAMPGPSQLSTAGRMGYLFLQSLLPNFPALIFIFASRPIYASIAAHVQVLGISAHADQQLAGVLAKLAGISILWGTAAGILLRAQRAEEEGRDPDPLVWDDVERELRRLQRRSDAP